MLFLRDDPQKRVRMLICECDIDDAQLAKRVVGLMDSSTDGEDLCIVDFLEALEQNPTKDAWKQLMKACPICLSSKPIRSVCYFWFLVLCKL